MSNPTDTSSSTDVIFVFVGIIEQDVKRAKNM